MAGKFTLFTGRNGSFYFNLKAGNGQIILQSQGYKDRAGATNGIDSVRRNAIVAGHYEKKPTDSGKFHFTLKAANGQVIGSSQTYESERACDDGIASVMQNAPDAGVVEE